MPAITPFLWFDHQAEEAAKFYTSIFKNSKLLSVSRWSGGSPYPEGSVKSATFELEGQKFYALNGGPHFHFTPAISLFVDCDTQAEVDALWERLLEGGKPSQCGWLTDRFGLSWQIIPRALGELMGDPNPKKAAAVTSAMMQMVKIDVQALRDAYDRA